MKAVALHRTEGSLHTLGDILAAVPGNNPSTARNQIHQSFERKLNGIEVAINIRMVEFNRGENHGIRKVMKKFRSLVEERRVILIAFDDEFLAIGDGKAGAEIFRNPSHQKRRIASRKLKDPRHHAGCRGLSVGSGNHQRVVSANEFLMHHLRHRDHREALIEQVLKLRIAPRDGIADHHQIGRRNKILLAEGLQDRDAERIKKGGHRRIRSTVRAAHIQSPQLQHPCQRGHGGTADSDQMNTTSLYQSKRFLMDLKSAIQFELLSGLRSTSRAQPAGAHPPRSCAARLEPRKAA